MTSAARRTLGGSLLLLAALGCGCAGEYSPTPLDGAKPATDRGGGSGDGPVTGDHTSPSPCKSNETHFKGSCYFTTGISAMDHQTAAGMCTALGSQPTSILSQEENDFIYGLLFHMTDSAWIGLTSSGADYAWEDGSTLGFTNWDSGEPDGSECGVMRGPLADANSQGKWADTSCTSKYREIVCKRKP